MAINLFCAKCKVSTTLSAKKCRRCGEPFGENRKYRVDVKSGDGKRASRVVDSIAVARKLEAKLKVQSMEGELFAVREVPRVGEVWDRFLEWAKSNKRTWKNDLYLWGKHIGPVLNGKLMNRVTPMTVQGILDGLRAQGTYTPATVKHVLVLTRRVYNWAREMGLYSGDNPTSTIKTPKLNNVRIDCLSREELGRLLATLNRWRNRRVAQLVKFALFTGCRRGEILSLRWADVDLDAQAIRLRNPKGGKDEVIPVNAEAAGVLREALAMRPSPECLYVFPSKSGGQRTCIKRVWARIKHKAGLPEDFRFHGLRHTFASYLASSGKVSLYVLQRLLTHKTPVMTQRYVHLMDETLREGANALSGMISG